MVHFIFKPRGGDPVFAEQQSPWMVIIQWVNGCRHVAGNFAVLSWNTVKTGFHWTYQAKYDLAEIIGQVGGIAWNERGMVSAAVPTHYAIEVMNMMERLNPAAQSDHQENLVALRNAKTAFIILQGTCLKIVPVFMEAPPKVADVSWRQHQGKNEVLVYMYEGKPSHCVRSPWKIENIVNSVHGDIIFSDDQYMVDLANQPDIQAAQADDWAACEEVVLTPAPQEPDVIVEPVFEEGGYEDYVDLSEADEPE